MAESKVPKAAKVETLHVPTHVILPSESEDKRPLNTVERRTKKTKKKKDVFNSRVRTNYSFKMYKTIRWFRETFNTFLINRNNAYDLATEVLKPIVFKYILCQLSGKAEVACFIKEFISLEQLKAS